MNLKKKNEDEDKEVKGVRMKAVIVMRKKMRRMKGRNGTRGQRRGHGTSGKRRGEREDWTRVSLKRRRGKRGQGSYDEGSDGNENGEKNEGDEMRRGDRG